ncbi:MAG: DNA polymerase I, partial [Butyrivibrio sp.]|nr:DNA polymerase I [Butyrivibrio sp.]
LQKLSASCRLSACDIKNSYHLYTPYEVDHQEEWTSSFDILLAAYLLNPLKNDYDPEDIAAEHLKLTMKGRAQRFGKNSLKGSDPKEVLAYAGELSQVCLKAAPVLEKKLADEEMLTLMRRIEMPLTYVLYDMQRVGIIVRRDELKEYGDQLTGRIGELEQHIHEEAGSDFNINSPKQLGEVLFGQMQIPGGKKTKSGYSTAADVLEKLAPDYPFVADILEYRGLTKLKSTYADGLADYIGSDNRIHTTYHQTITATGRISSTDPNLQNIPMRTELGRMIRKVFVPQEGYLFSDADYSQIELRILAHMSGDKELIAAYHEGRDIHRITASKVFHTPFAEVTPLQRRNAKAVNFGIVYGISAFGLSNDLNISRSEAKEYMDQYLKTYPGVKKYQEEAVALAKERGYAITMFGRRRPMPELKASNFMQRQFGERVAMNAPIQGTAADIMKIGMLRVFRRIRKEKLHSRLILQIHDELVVETAPDELKQIEDILTQEMTGAADLAVPLDVDCHSGSDWFEAKG